MKDEYPRTTLFLLASVDGKISTGSTDLLDIDKDFPKIKGVREGLYQYYELEKWTDLFSLNSGRVLEKVGVNKKVWKGSALPVSFIVIDNKPHLSKKGLEYLSKKSKMVFIVTTNKNHPALKTRFANIKVLFYKKLSLGNVMRRLKKEGANRITLQTGGTFNTEFVRAGLVDHVSLVIAPILVGGSDTQSIMGWQIITERTGAFQVKGSKVEKCKKA